MDAGGAGCADRRSGRGVVPEPWRRRHRGRHGRREAPGRVPIDRDGVGRDRRHALRRHRVERDGQDRQPAGPRGRPRAGRTGARADRRRAGAEQRDERRRAGARRSRPRNARCPSRCARRRPSWPPPRRARRKPTSSATRLRAPLQAGPDCRVGVRDRARRPRTPPRAQVASARPPSIARSDRRTPPPGASRRRAPSRPARSDTLSKTCDRLAHRRHRQPPARPRGRDGRDRHPEPAGHDADDHLRPQPIDAEVKVAEADVLRLALGQPADGDARGDARQAVHGQGRRDRRQRAAGHRHRRGRARVQGRRAARQRRTPACGPASPATPRSSPASARTC